MSTDINASYQLEIYLFKWGCALGVLFGGGLLLSPWWLSDQFGLLWTMTVMDITVGRYAGMYAGFMGGLSLPLVVAVNVIIDMGWVFLGYPVVMLSLQKLTFFPALQGMMQRVGQVAQAQHKRWPHWGVMGLFSFVLIPLPLTGPVVGAVIGHWMGLPLWKNMILVLSATYIKVGLWAWALFMGQDRLSLLGPMVSYTVLAILIMAGVMARALSSRPSQFLLSQKRGQHD